MLAPLKPVLGYIIINIDPVAFNIGGLQIRWYGLAYVLAIGIALWAIMKYVDALGVAREIIWNIFLWVALAGLIGGRLYFVIQQPNFVDNYLKQPANIFAVWNGGMAFFGAIFLAAPTAAILAWRSGLSPWLALDIAGLFGAVGQMFGRLGNIVNGDIVGYSAGGSILAGNVCPNAPCVGYVQDPHIVPWATAYINSGSFVPERGIPYQPSALYEIVVNLVALAILWPLRLILPRRVGTGAFFSLYVAFYAIGQFFIFFGRSNVYVPFMGTSAFKQAQWTAIFTFIGIALFYFFIVRRFGRPWTYGPENPLPVAVTQATAGDVTRTATTSTPPTTPRVTQTSESNGNLSSSRPRAKADVSAGPESGG